MKWIEFLGVNGSRRNIELLETNLPEKLGQLVDAEGFERGILLSLAMDQTQLVVILAWERDGSPRKTREGLLLAEYLELFGLVNHKLLILKTQVVAEGTELGTAAMTKEEACID